MPSQQSNRLSRDYSQDYVSQQMPLPSQIKVENNYRRIKQEEAAARARLIAPRQEPLSQRRNGSLLESNKYKPSANAMAQYSPIRNELSVGAIPQFIPPVSAHSQDPSGIISNQDLKSLRAII